MSTRDSTTAERRLLRRRAEILRLQHQSESNERELVEVKEPDWMDLAAEHSQAAALESLNEREVGELRAISAALQRVREGSYGVCVECGADINARRLHALPWADRCVSCLSEAD